MSWPPFESEADWEDLVRRFEAGALTKEEWTHGRTCASELGSFRAFRWRRRVGVTARACVV